LRNTPHYIPPEDHVAEQEEVYRLKNGPDRLTFRQIADRLGIHYEAVKRRYRLAKKRVQMDPELRRRLEFAGVTDFGSLHSGWIIDKDEKGAGQSLYFYFGKDDKALSTEEFLDAMRDEFSRIPKVRASKAPRVSEQDGVAFFPLPDWHLGAVVSEKETGVAYNRKIAVERLMEGFSSCHAAIPACGTAIILVLGDMTHANDDRHRTPRSGHPLLVEGTHHQNLLLACQTVCWSIDLALQKHGRVVVSFRKGNHDPQTPVAMLMAVRERYANEPRVQVADDEDAFFSFHHGRLFIAAHHGDGQKLKDLSLSVPYRFRKEWGASDHHYLFTGHHHHQKRDTFGGLHSYQLKAICALDQHANQMGYADTSGMSAFHFSATDGLRAEYTIRF